MCLRSSLVASVKAKCAFPTESESERIISGFRWIGLFSSEACQVRNGNLLDTLCARLEGLMKYEQGERDLVMLQHKFIVEWADGSVVGTFLVSSLNRRLTSFHTNQQTLTSTLEQYGSPSGHSAMALTVGLPCGIATQLVLDGVLNEPGVHAPYDEKTCAVLREVLEKEGVGMVERVL